MNYSDLSPATIAFALFVIFISVAFGLRTLQHLRKTGTTGFQGLSGKPGFVPWIGGVFFVLALTLGALASVLEWVGIITSLFKPAQWLVDIGIAITSLGILGTYEAQNAMGKSWLIGVRESEHTELVTHGAFRWVRNPVFTYMLMSGIGLVLILPNALAFTSLVCLFIACELQMRFVEEPYLYRTHRRRFS